MTQKFCVLSHFLGRFYIKPRAGTAVRQLWVWASCEQHRELAAGTDIEPEVRESSANTESRKSHVSTLTLFGGNYHLTLSLCSPSNISLRDYNSLQRKTYMMLYV